MGATKFEIHDEELIKMANLLKAIAHPVRLKAVLIIANETDGDVTIKEIQKNIKLTQSTISQHLKVLKENGFIVSKMVVKNNKSCVIYRLNIEALSQLDVLLKYLYKKSEIKQDNQYVGLKEFYNQLIKINNWNQCFAS
jgi:ArsR family transcriptional regulator